jgi:hypothetical protein
MLTFILSHCAVVTEVTDEKFTMGGKAIYLILNCCCIIVLVGFDGPQELI